VQSIATLAAPDIDELRRRAAEVCVVYLDHRLPLGASPTTSRLGVECTGDRARLLVNRGATYTGSNADIANWLSSGSRSFDSIDDLIGWVQGWAHAPEHITRPRVGDPTTLTDLDAVSTVDTTSTAPDAEALAAILLSEVIGQDLAIRELALSVARHAGKRFPRRPLTVMLLGSTGVGKSLAAEVTARALSNAGGGDWNYLRVDLSEFSERHTVSRLVGAPPGYVGYGDTSLASRLAAQPRTVILFDEVDKAHPEVALALMNLMDAGRLDSVNHGEVTAEKSILLFTSNLGAASIPEADTVAEMDATGRRHLLAHAVAPELVGRFSRVLTFGQLAARNLAAVAAKSIATVAADYGCSVDSVEPDYITELLSASNSVRLGVRLLEHSIDRDLGAELAAIGPVRVTVHANSPRVRAVDSTTTR